MPEEIITSAQNKTIKHLKKLLTSSKYRREQGLAVAEGVHLLASMLDAGTDIEQIIYAESARKNQEIADATIRLQAQTARVTTKDSLFESASHIHATVGVIAVFKIPKTDGRAVLDSSGLILEDIQDPGNLGTILRTAAAAGVSNVYLSEDSASAYSPKALRAGMGAQFGLKIYEDVDLVSLVEQASVPVIATSLGADRSLYETNLSADCAWVFGNEGQGVSAKLLSVCTQKLIIPQSGELPESLNVASSVAVCLFEHYRQRLLAKS